MKTASMKYFWKILLVAKIFWYSTGHSCCHSLQSISAVVTTFCTGTAGKHKQKLTLAAARPRTHPPTHCSTLPDQFCRQMIMKHMLRPSLGSTRSEIVVFAEAVYPVALSVEPTLCHYCPEQVLEAALAGWLLAPLRPCYRLVGLQAVEGIAWRVSASLSQQANC